jgi:spore germination protein YaaH
MSHRRRNGIAIVAVVTLLVALTVFALGPSRLTPQSLPTTTIVPTIPTTTNPYAAEEARNVTGAEQAVSVALPATTGTAAPALPSHGFRAPLGSHQTVGFVPYYELTAISSENLSAFTDLVYYDVEVQADGTLVESDSSGGWTALENGGAGDLVTAGHADGDRVLLSLFTESSPVLAALSAHASTAGPRLADEIAPLLSGTGFDGVDLDLEGEDASSRGGFVAFVAAFSQRLRAIDRSWTIMLNTYPQSAEDPEGFFDVKALAPYVNEMFVMAYDMDDTEIPSADAPLDGADLSDVIALATYVGAGLGRKVILGIPFYGYDFPASGPANGAATTGSPYAVTYDQILASITVDGHKPLWDPVTETPYIVFKRKGAWHQTWFDDPVSAALKTALATEFRVAGVGAWELGMVARSPQMISVLEGQSPVVKLPLATQP